ncbi:hypothetical protein HJC23_014103 [Cyclotella cryptica]|uniref:Bifunctional dihydrofolate reductase-thymidylate synthase n=1 Tax=Cyclotella cryptica TaxID=29204 RepID=A0ABD3QTK8_9STRA|eukprot:CCRYP_002510-RA/>CCRYP_002510-RA protein AED:0.05 eAED:0.05 QI:10/1/1/1/1/1/4/150/567
MLTRLRRTTQNHIIRCTCCIRSITTGKVKLPAFQTMMDVAAVVAAAAGSRGIGYDGKMPWRSLPGDMAHFKKVTTTPPSPGLTNAVIMGRKTWDSIPPKFRPLEGRVNIVLSRKGAAGVEGIPSGDSSAEENVLVAASIEEAMDKLERRSNLGSTFIIGGGEIYSQGIQSGLVKRVIYTNVKGLPEDTKFDAFFPELSEKEWDCVPLDSKENAENEDVNRAAKRAKKAMEHVDAKSGLRYEFLEFIRREADAPTVSSTESDSSVQSDAIPEGPDVNPEEMQYLEICRDIIENGVKRGDRTGTGTLSKFGVQMRYSLRGDTLPLLTTKRTFWRGVAEELLWFVKGSTNANELAAKNIHIWDGNGSREFLDSRGLQHREQGDLGPVYGFQWRHFGAEYKDMHTDYTGQGVDQLADCIDKIINNPEDRRIIMSAWNPKDLDLMALPPCHMFCQFYVDTEKNEVSCQMYQRSADMGLGVPFNIASYALLTHMIAKVTGRKAGDFVHTIGDAHVYLNHVDALREQLQRKPRAFPKLKMKDGKEFKDIDSFEYEDFEVVGYKPHGTIKMKMAV